MIYLRSKDQCIDPSNIIIIILSLKKWNNRQLMILVNILPCYFFPRLSVKLNGSIWSFDVSTIQLQLYPFGIIWNDTCKLCLFHPCPFIYGSNFFYYFHKKNLMREIFFKYWITEDGDYNDKIIANSKKWCWKRKFSFLFRMGPIAIALIYHFLFKWLWKDFFLHEKKTSGIFFYIFPFVRPPPTFIRFACVQTSHHIIKSIRRCCWIPIADR